MALGGTQLGAFNSYRYLVGKVDLVASQSKGKVEDTIRSEIAQGDTDFAFRRYQPALDHYLAAYSAAHAYLHPSFPFGTLKLRPELLFEINALEAITSAVEVNAKFRHVDGLPPTVAPFDPPRTLLRVLEQAQEGGVAPLSAAEVHFSSAMNLLAVGAFEQAEATFATAKLSNRGPSRSEALLGRITVGEAAARIGAGQIDRAAESLKAAERTFAEIGQSFARGVVSENISLLEQRLGADRDADGADAEAGEAENPADGVATGFATNRLITGTVAAATHLNRIPNLTVGSGRGGGVVVVTPPPPPEPPPVAPIDKFVLPLETGKLTGVDLATAEKVTAATTFGISTWAGTQQIDLTQEKVLLEKVLAPRKTATELAILWPHFELPETFLAYVPHVYGYVLPMSIGDCYAKLGRREKAVEFYLKALDYPHLNQAIEGAQVWLKAARVIVAEADHLFRSRREADARTLYESLVDSAGAVPSNTRLFRAAPFTPMRALAQQAVTAIDNGVVFGANPMMASIIAHARAQLAKLDGGLNWLGLADDVVPIWTFDFLQSTARYFAQHVVQSWRQYISFRNSAEAEEATQRELEQAIVLNDTAERTQEARLDLARSQLDVTRALLDGARLHRDNLRSQRDQFDQVGWVIAELGRFEQWWGNANLGGNYESNHWDWGGGFELSIGAGSGQERIDEAARYRNRLSHQMQIDNFNRQIAEANNQIVVAERQLEVASAQVEVAQLELQAARQRTEFARQNLEFFEQQEFTPDLWHALADALGEVAEDYLNMGIYAAFLMERAYNVEHDRNLQRIRFDYPDAGGAAELTSGDSLLLDIDSFSHDLLISVDGRPNPIRHVISLADFAPQAFFDFRRTGVLEFTVPIDEIERAYPGTYLHRIQSVEVEIEGLQVPEGIHGSLEHLGVSSWRRKDGSLQSRVSAPESMVLSGFNLRRDLALFRVDQDRLRVFENSGTAASWRLSLPPGTNDVDFDSIFDVRLVLHFTAMHDPQLEAQIRATFPADGQAAQGFSARLHAPDQYFVFGPADGQSDSITFTLDPRAFPFNQRDLEITELGVFVLQDQGQDPAVPFTGIPLSVELGGTSRSGTTDGDGVIHTDSGGGALADFIGEDIDDVKVTFTGPAAQRGEVADVHLFLNYRYLYR